MSPEQPYTVPPYLINHAKIVRGGIDRNVLPAPNESISIEDNRIVFASQEVYKTYRIVLSKLITFYLETTPQKEVYEDLRLLEYCLHSHQPIPQISLEHDVKSANVLKKAIDIISQRYVQENNIFNYKRFWTTMRYPFVRRDTLFVIHRYMLRNLVQDAKPYRWGQCFQPKDPVAEHEYTVVLCASYILETHKKEIMNILRSEF